MELDVSKKVRTAIKAKLLELGVHVDEELPDYIMILIANRRSKEQMEEDLGLFLSDNTLKFTSWLHQVLKKLQEVTTSAPAAKPVSSAAPAVVSVPSVKKPQEEQPRPEKIVESKLVTVKTAPVPKEMDTKGSNNKRRKVESDKVKETQADEEESKSPTHKKLKISRQPVISPVRPEVSTKRQAPEENSDSEVTHSVKPIKYDSKKATKENSTKVQSSITVVNAKPNRSKSPVSAPASRRIERSRSPAKLDRSPIGKKGRNSPVSVPSKRRYSSSQRDRSSSPGFKKSIRNSRKNSRSRSRSGSPTTKARKSLRSLVAVVKRHNELNALKDEEYNPNRPQVSSTSVASVVHVTPRPKRATKQEGGSNKLLFRALADAQKSIASHSASAKVSSGDKDKEKSDNTDISKIDSKPRKSSESSNSKSSKIDEERTLRKEARTIKPSIKDRLGYRLGNRIPVAQRLAEAPRHQDLESEEYPDDFLPDGDDNYKSIIINVPTSKDSKERSVHLEDESKRSTQGVSMEEPKRLSIQVNVDSDDTSSSEDELEIQPGPSEDLNLEPKDNQTENKTINPSFNSKKESSESEEEAETESVRNQTESGKSSPNEESSSKVLHLDETSKHSEELEIEEYEEIEEEEDDEEYDVVIQERNIALPDPGEYDSGRKDKNDMEVENEAAAMDTTDSKDCSSAVADMEDGVRAYTPENVRYPLNLRSFNHGDTKFVVTMDGSDDPYYSNEEQMETNEVPLRGVGDLRHRISRSILASKVYPTGLSPPAMPVFNQARPFLPITGAPHPFNGPLTTAAAAPQCKYWPECSFKDKCIYPHPKCKFGENCTKPQCPYKHESGVFGNGSNTEAQGSTKGSSENNEGKIQCKFFPKCHSMSCQFYHPSPCRFGVGCTDAKCKNFHPGQTVGQQRSKNKLFGAVTRPKSYRAPPPAAHLLRWKAPSTSFVPVVASDNKEESNVEDNLATLVDASASTA